LQVTTSGIRDDKWGEPVKAVLAMRKGMKASEEGMIEHYKRRLASYKKANIQRFPRSSYEKIQGRSFESLKAVILQVIEEGKMEKSIRREVDFHIMRDLVLKIVALEFILYVGLKRGYSSANDHALSGLKLTKRLLPL
jgi:hypothetical protein